MRKNQSNNLTIQQLNNSRFPRGVTLVELLIYMGIFSIFLLVLTDMFVSILELRKESEAVSAVDIDSRYLLSRLAYDISRATSITTPATSGVPGTNNLSIVIGGITYSYAIFGNQLQVTNDLGVDSLNSSETTISNANFQKIGNPAGKDTIKIQLTINSKTVRSTGQETKTIQTTVGRR